MKAILFIFSLILTLPLMAAKENRKISSSVYFNCILEREGGPRAFKKSLLFPFPVEEDETQEIKGSMRWNNYLIRISNKGKVEVKVSENINGRMVIARGKHEMGKDPEFGSFKIKLELKGQDVTVPYTITCGPE